jgi:F-type H+-transporting ATPase subunit delta
MSNNSGLATIAERYALAMFELAQKQNAEDEINSDLAKVDATMNENAELVTFLQYPTVSPVDKKDVIDKVFANYISKNTLNLIKLLLDRNRLFLLPFISRYYTDILNKKRNIIIAQVITAIEIDEDTKNRVKEKLERLFNQNITIKSEIDTDIIAGMVVKIGDKTIDGSIKTKLENFRKQLV